MPAPPRRRHAERVIKRLEKAEATRQRFETLFDSGQITVTDLLFVYRGLFIQNVGTFETFLETVFYSIVLQRDAYPARVSRRIRVESTASLRILLLGGHDFIDWLPFTRTLD